MNHTRTGLLALLLLVMVSSLISCKVSKHSSSQTTDAGETSRILFINYQVARDSSNATFDVRVINMNSVTGTIKDLPADTRQPVKDDLELMVLDSHQQIMTHRYIPNPLDRSIEYVNDARQLD